ISPQRTQGTQRKKEIQTESYFSAVLALSAVNLKKQSQFAGRVNQCKLLFESRLWQYSCLRPAKKQSQTNPIYRPSAGNSK
ncbi:MAG: hypothetical protein ACYSUD_14450, partial [Planctomycetota bacterium]